MPRCWKRTCSSRKRTLTPPRQSCLNLPTPPSNTAAPLRAEIVSRDGPTLWPPAPLRGTSSWPTSPTDIGRPCWTTRAPTTRRSLHPRCGPSGPRVNWRGTAEGPQIKDGGLRWWFPSTPPGASDNQRPPARWSSDGEHVGHLAGFEHGLLYFEYPLTGEFEFSAEGYHGPWAESDLGYGGIVVEAQIMQLGTLIWPLGLAEQLRRPDPVEYGDVFNRLQVKVSNGSMRYLVNGHLVYEDTVSSPTAPWLYFYAHYPRHTAFKNVRLTGKPTIPREVKLTHGDRLEGWVSAFYNQSQPPRRTRHEQIQPDPFGAARAESGPAAFDWESRDGVIHGRFDATTSPERAQSRLYYHRPLRSGDTLRYQFMYRPGSHHVHPGLGRLAFLLDPAGIRLHWMTSADATAELFNLGPRNFVEEPQNRRGPTPLPLRPDDWNDVEVTLRGDTAAIKLNGALIYERELEPENDRRFSLFHFRDESGVQVRKAVLKGDWPEALPAEVLANPLALRPEAATPQARAQSSLLIGEHLLAVDAYDVWKRARAMPAAERYDYLVLGSSERGSSNVSIDRRFHADSRATFSG